MGSSNSINPQFTPIPHHDHDPQPSDLNHLAQVHDDALAGDLHNKLDFKDGDDETQNKGSNFEPGHGQLYDEAAVPEPVKEQRSDDGADSNEQLHDEAAVPEPDKEQKCDADDEQLNDEAAVPEPGKEQRCDDGDGLGNQQLNDEAAVQEPCKEQKCDADNDGNERLYHEASVPEPGKEQRCDYGDGNEQLYDEAAVPEPCKEQKCDDVHDGNEQLYDGAAVPEPAKEQRCDDDDGANGQLYDEADVPDLGKEQKCDDVHNGNEQLYDGASVPEPGKVQRCDEEPGEEQRCDDGDANVKLYDEAAIPEPGKEQSCDDDGANQQLYDEAAVAESGKEQRCDDDGANQQLYDEAAVPDPGMDQWYNDYYDGWNGGDEGYNWIENASESWNNMGDGDVVYGVEGSEVENNDERSSGRAQQYPLRPDAEDCAFYLRTGTCKFGFNCRFNHPVRRKSQAVKEVGERDETEERSGQTECKYYLRSGGCKFGKACKFNHTQEENSAAPDIELNFLGLPIRLGEKECLYYMRTGSCKFGANCKFNHPDPTAVGGCDTPSGYSTNGSSISLQGVSQSSIPSWSSTRTLKETSLVPIILSQNSGVSHQSSEWSGYQAPGYLSERSMHPPSTYVMNNPASETNIYMHHQKKMPAYDFPERPGEPECSFFLKTGDCKFKSNCKFHHPKNRITRVPPCSLSDKGLPLRPDQNVCSHYSRYGICKFGPACRFDHPRNPPPSTMPVLDQQSSFSGSGGASDVIIQQHM